MQVFKQNIYNEDNYFFNFFCKDYINKSEFQYS